MCINLQIGKSTEMALANSAQAMPTGWTPHDGRGLPGLSCCPAHADPQRARGCRRGGGGRGGEGGGDGKNTGPCFQSVFQLSRSRLPSHTPCDFSAICALRSPFSLSDTLPLCRRWFNLDTWCLRGLGVFWCWNELPSRMLVFVSAALSVPSRNGSSASKLSAQLMTCPLRMFKAARPGQLHESVGGILKVSHKESQATVLELASSK